MMALEWNDFIGCVGNDSRQVAQLVTINHKLYHHPLKPDYQSVEFLGMIPGQFKYSSPVELLQPFGIIPASWNHSI